VTSGGFGVDEALKKVGKQLLFARDDAGQFPEMRADRREIDPMQKLRAATTKEQRCLGIDVGHEERGEEKSAADAMPIERGQDRFRFSAKCEKLSSSICETVKRAPFSV
jgi:hypothetical protein